MASNRMGLLECFCQFVLNYVNISTLGQSNKSGRQHAPDWSTHSDHHPGPQQICNSPCAVHSYGQYKQIMLGAAIQGCEKVLPKPSKLKQNFHTKYLKNRQSDGTKTPLKHFYRCYTTTSYQFKKDYYSLLGIERTASQAEISSAFRNQAQKYHPDKNSAKEATAMFLAIKEAYDCLKDPSKRKSYDISQFSSYSSTEYSASSSQSYYRQHNPSWSGTKRSNGTGQTKRNSYSEYAYSSSQWGSGGYEDFSTQRQNYYRQYHGQHSQQKQQRSQANESNFDEEFWEILRRASGRPPNQHRYTYTTPDGKTRTTYSQGEFAQAMAYARRYHLKNQLNRIVQPYMNAILIIFMLILVTISYSRGSAFPPIDSHTPPIYYFSHYPHYGRVVIVPENYDTIRRTGQQPPKYNAAKTTKDQMEKRAAAKGIQTEQVGISPSVTTSSL